METICSFLGVTCNEDYLHQAENILFGKPSETRRTVVWTEEQKQRVYNEMKKYPFLQSFSFEEEDWLNDLMHSAPVITATLAKSVVLSIEKLCSFNILNESKWPRIDSTWLRQNYLLKRARLLLTIEMQTHWESISKKWIFPPTVGRWERGGTWEKKRKSKSNETKIYGQFVLTAG